jgi:hypothetical protein
MSTVEVVNAYKSLTFVERAFRNLKTVQLEIRPVYHKTDERIRSHVFLCMLAYYLQWHMEQRLAAVCSRRARSGKALDLSRRDRLLGPDHPQQSHRQWRRVLPEQHADPGARRDTELVAGRDVAIRVKSIRKPHKLLVILVNSERADSACVAHLHSDRRDADAAANARS